MLEKLTDIFAPAGWIGMLIMAAWQFFTTQKERRLAQDKDSTAITAADITNAKSMFEFWKAAIKDLEERLEKQQKRIGDLEGTLRKQIFDHNQMLEDLRKSYEQKIEEIRTNYETKIDDIDERNRTSFQNMESFYRQKCQECEENHK